MKKLRQCLVTKRSFVKTELLRLVKLNNKLKVDFNQTLQGRGYYLSIDALKLQATNLKTLLSKRLKVSCSLTEIEQIIWALQQLKTHAQKQIEKLQ